MSDVIHLLVRTLLRVLLLLAGFVFFASVVLVAGLLLTLWLLRALWARLTGRPVTPWVFRMNRQPPWQRGGFAKPASTTPMTTSPTFSPSALSLTEPLGYLNSISCGLCPLAGSKCLSARW